VFELRLPKIETFGTERRVKIVPFVDELLK
jgi:hypothetical protein